MKQNLINKLIDSLPKERTLFHYFKDRYAILLLNHLIGDGLPIREIKQSHLARLLDRPKIKTVIAGKGDGILTPNDILHLWPIDPLCYRLTLGSWGKEKGSIYWQQTTRAEPNLVLHLNFSNQHDEAYNKFIGKHQSPFVYYEHPIARTGFNTLAWSRMDINFETGEALIEELQTDWLRYVRLYKAYVTMTGRQQIRANDEEIIEYRGVKLKRGLFNKYIYSVIQPHIKLWDEAMLSATIWFLSEEIGIKKIYIHQADCGARLKQISNRLPPRSLYTDLPKKFCFKLINREPEFIDKKTSKTFRTLKKQNKLQFWILENAM